MDTRGYGFWYSQLNYGPRPDLPDAFPRWLLLVSSGPPLISGYTEYYVCTLCGVCTEYGVSCRVLYSSFCIGLAFGSVALLS